MFNNKLEEFNDNLTFLSSKIDKIDNNYKIY